MPPPKDPKKYEEWLRRNRESHKGKPSPFKGMHHKQDAIDANRNAHLGRKDSEETLRKKSEAHKGQVPWNTNKTGVYSPERIEQLRNQMLGNQHAKGLKHTNEWKKERSDATLGENNPFYGQEHTDKAKCDISKANMGKPSPMKDKHHTEETKALLKITRSQQVFPQKDSKPEKILQLNLMLHGIKFEKHKLIPGQPDIFIEPNICIFVDGDYWHANPKRFRPEDMVTQEISAKDRWKMDNDITTTLIKSGNIVLRLWESNIKKDPVKQVNFIQRFLKQELEPLQLRMN